MKISVVIGGTGLDRLENPSPSFAKAKHDVVAAFLPKRRRADHRRAG